MNKLTGWMGDAGPVCGAGRPVKPWRGIACDEGLRVAKVDFVALTHEARSGEVPPILTHEEGHKLTGDIKHLALLQNLKTLALTSTGATGDVAHFRGHQLKQIFISDTRTGGNMDGVCDQCGEFGHECVQWLLNCLSLLFCGPLLKRRGNFGWRSIYYDDCGSHPCESERLDGTRAGNSDEWCCEPRAEDTVRVALECVRHRARR